jgi:hypothetical protein
MRIVAVTRDGRRAERIVGSAESLVARALGLLMTIPALQPPVQAEGRAPRTPVVSEAQPATPVAALANATAPRATALWAGLSGGLRLAAPNVSERDRRRGANRHHLRPLAHAGERAILAGVLSGALGTRLRRVQRCEPGGRVWTSLSNRWAVTVERLAL